MRRLVEPSAEQHFAYEASIEVASASARPVTQLYGDGSDGRRDHLLDDGQLLTGVRMPPPLASELAAYFRTTARARAEWPLVEAIVRLTVTDGQIGFARIAVGGVAPVPLRLPAVESALIGQAAEAGVLERAAALATDGARPLPMTRYKLGLLPATVRETLTRTCAS